MVSPFIIICGSLHLDIVVTAPSLPVPDETVVGGSWAQVCGGKGGNQAVQAARAGARAAMIGRVGNDDFGKTLRANLAEAGVDHSAVEIDRTAGSGMSVAITRDDGDYGAVIVSGANLNMTPDVIVTQLRRLGAAKVVVLQNEIPADANLAAARMAAELGAKVILNAAPMRAVDQALLRFVDVLVVNRVEATALLGHTIHDRASARAALAQWGDKTRSIVITLGGDGVVGLAHGELFEVAGLHVKVRSTHGAGDCFVGVLATEIAGGADLHKACIAANGKAAEFVSR